MVRQLSTIIEIDFNDVDLPFVENGASMKLELAACDTVMPSQSDDVISCKSLGKDTVSCSSIVEAELSEPECELDPLEVSIHAIACDSMSLQPTQPTHATKSRKKRHASLIDKALKAQQKQSQDLLSPSEPAYIRFSDLAADWSLHADCSLHASRSATRSFLATVLPVNDVVAHEKVDLHEATLSTKTKRNRKKSLIDKAALQQRREELEMQQSKMINY